MSEKTKVVVGARCLPRNIGIVAAMKEPLSV
jgi:hypothetical protein